MKQKIENKRTEKLAAQRQSSLEPVKEVPSKKSLEGKPAAEGSVTSKVARMSAGPPRMMSMRVPKAGLKEETKLE